MIDKNSSDSQQATTNGAGLNFGVRWKASLSWCTKKQSASIATGQSRGVIYGNARSRSETLSYSLTSIAWVRGRATIAVS